MRTHFHVCVTVWIKDYTTQINGVDYQELTTANNAALSNYSRFITGESSPANIDRIPMFIKNTLDDPAYASIHTGASHSEYQFSQNELVFLLKANEERLVHIGVRYEKDRAWGNGYKGYEPGPQARVVFKGRLQPAQHTLPVPQNQIDFLAWWGFCFIRPEKGP